MSEYLFILCIEPLAMTIKYNSNIKGFTFGDIKLKIGQYTDDTIRWLWTFLKGSCGLAKGV